MRLTLRMRITLLTGAAIMLAAFLLTVVSMYNADNKIQKVVRQAAVLTVELTNIQDLSSGSFVAKSEDAAAFKELKLSPSDFLSMKERMFPKNKMITSVKATPLESVVEMSTLQAAYATPAETARKEFNTSSMAIMAAVALAGMLVSYCLAGRALKPVHELNAAVSHMSAENLKDRLSAGSGNDEIGELQKSYNAMLDRLEESFWKQKRFASNAAHELKTPLATIKTGIQVLNVGGEPTAEDYKETITIAARQIDRLSAVVDDLLILTNQGYDDRIKQLELNEILNEVVEDLTSVSETKEITVQIDSGSESCFISGNESLTYRLFYNLAENAIKYNNRGGTVKIQVIHILSAEGDSVCVTVSDSGMGMKPEETEKIFEPFYCIDPSRSRKMGGAGLGLAIVKDIADRYDWEISVESGENEGTAFQVSIPVLLDL